MIGISRKRTRSWSLKERFTMFRCMARTIFYMPYALFIGVDDGLYEVEVFDRDKKVIQKGYIWCIGQNRRERMRVIKKEISEHRICLPRHHSIQFTRLFDLECIISVDNAFELRKQNSFDYKHLWHRRHEYEPWNKYLYECTITHNKETRKYYVFTKEVNRAKQMLKKVIREKNHNIFNFYKFNIRRHERKNTVIWGNLECINNAT
jgi:hypothetical protein